jgi:hypothetical protein
MPSARPIKSVLLNSALRMTRRGRARTRCGTTPAIGSNVQPERKALALE